MRIHHLNCGSMRLPGAPMVSHVLLIETGNGLVLVDSGFGLLDVAEPARRLGFVRHVIKPVLDPEETAVRQVQRLGFRPEDVRHIVLTHFDSDHTGGLADFPQAQVHVTAAEAVGAVHHPNRFERLRFPAAHREHGLRLVEHDPDGERWRGFAAARPLDQIDPGIVLISLPGHTRGHAAVAVEGDGQWILHAGDAFFHHGTLDGHSRVPPALAVQEQLVAHDRRQVRANHARLAELHRRGEPDLRIVNAHDPALLPTPGTA